MNTVQAKEQLKNNNAWLFLNTTFVVFYSGFIISFFYNGPGSGLPIFLVSGLLFVSSFWLLERNSFAQQQLKLPTDGISIVAYCYIAWLFLNLYLSRSNQLTSYLIWQFIALPAVIILWKLIETDRQYNWDTVWRLITTTITVLAVFGCIQYFTLDSDKIQGSFSDPNSFASIINAVIAPLTLGYFAKYRESSQKKILLQEAIIFILLAAVIFSASRTALFIFWAIFAISILITVLLKSFSVISLLRYIIIIAMVVFIYSATSEERTFNYKETTESHTMQVRYMLWKSSLEIYKTEPLTGTGIGTFSAIYPAFRDPAEKYTAGHMVHNDYLQFLQEGGPVQLLFLLSAGLFTAYLFFRSLLLSLKNKSSINTTGLLIGAGSIFVHSLVNFNFYQLSVTLLLGLYLSHASTVLLGSNIKTFKLRFSKLFIQSAFVIIFLIPAGGLFLDSIGSLLFFPSKNSLYSGTIPLEMEKKLQAARTLDTLRPKNYFVSNFLVKQYFEAYFNSKNQDQKELFFELSEYQLKKQIQIFPQDYHAYKLLGMLHHAHATKNTEADYNTAIKYLQKALEVNPMHLPAHTALAKIYFQQGQYNKAQYQLLEDASKWFSMPQKKLENSYIPVLETAIGFARAENQETDLLNIADMLHHMNPENEFANSVLKELESKTKKPLSEVSSPDQ